MSGKDEDTTANGIYVGIDAGSVSVNCVALDEYRNIVHEAPYTRHFGRVEEQVIFLLEELYSRYGEERIRCVSFTGNHGKHISRRLSADYEFETICQLRGALFLQPDVKSIISMGGQDTSLAQIKFRDGKWDLDYFNTNGPCASGTGSFIDQQAERLATQVYDGVTDTNAQIDAILSDFISLGLKSSTPSKVACRCTVFTKSDMIHLQNKGEALKDIIFGLHVGNARNYVSAIVSNRKLEAPILFIGGLSRNALQIRAMKQYFPDLAIPPFSTSVGALGAALQALEERRENRIHLPNLKQYHCGSKLIFPKEAKLTVEKTQFPETNTLPLRDITAKTKAFLGIDIGSTTTKYALIDEHNAIIHKCYLPTQGKPIETTQRLLKYLFDNLGAETRIAAVATTGSGRNVVGDFLSADLVMDEITAHARGAVALDPCVDTIFEIGGQDSKYISIHHGTPLDFDMNKVCAAGTGSFLHELASKYGINIVGEFQEVALSSDSPVKLAERCTVFMESDLVSYHQKGVPKQDLMAGLCYAIVRNYLNRVVGKRKVGDKIMFLGGPSLNKAVVAAFENVMGREIIIPPHREVLGAFGAAVALKESLCAGETGAFRNLKTALDDRMEYEEKICRANKACHNECKLKIYDFDGRKSIWGGECGRYEAREKSQEGKTDFFQVREKIWEKHMHGVWAEVQDAPVMTVDGRETVGMQRALYGLGGTVFWGHFFDSLGYRLVLTPPTNQKISDTGVEKVLVEACYPVKVSHGHVAFLGGKTKYLFLPTLVDMPASGKERGYYCPMVQCNSYMLRSALGIRQGTMLTPVLHMRNASDILAVELHEQLSKPLKVEKAALKRALRHAVTMQAHFAEELLAVGREALDALDPGEAFIAVTGRPYNLYDERLNLRIGRTFSKMGVSAIPMDFLDVESEDIAEFPDMYWGLGARILRAAKFIKRTPNCFGLHLTNFGCGADSFIEHFYKHIMGDKANLILELDEHSAAAGVLTRLEAFNHVINNSMHPIVMTTKKGGCHVFQQRI